MAAWVRFDRVWVSKGGHGFGLLLEAAGFAVFVLALLLGLGLYAFRLRRFRRPAGVVRLKAGLPKFQRNAVVPFISVGIAFTSLVITLCVHR